MKKHLRIKCNYCSHIGIDTNGISYSCKLCKQNWSVATNKIASEDELSDEWKEIIKNSD